LPLDTLDERGSIPATDRQSDIRVQQATAVHLRDQALVPLRVDDPDARRADDQVVDVCGGPGPTPIVQHEQSARRHGIERRTEPLFADGPGQPRIPVLRWAGEGDLESAEDRALQFEGSPTLDLGSPLLLALGSRRAARNP
jgi:hypothetical protein